MLILRFVFFKSSSFNFASKVSIIKDKTPLFKSHELCSLTRETDSLELQHTGRTRAALPRPTVRDPWAGLGDRDSPDLPVAWADTRGRAALEMLRYDIKIKRVVEITEWEHRERCNTGKEVKNIRSAGKCWWCLLPSDLATLRKLQNKLDTRACFWRSGEIYWGESDSKFKETI